MKRLLRRGRRRERLKRDRPPRRHSPPLKGCMRHVIVVKPPDRRFREAMFILRDDYFLDGAVDEAELLRQAKAAAKDYVREAIPVRRSLAPWLLLALTLPAALLGLRLMGLI